MMADRLPDRLFSPAEAQKLADLLNAAQLFGANWRRADLMRTSPRTLVTTFERDPRAGSLRTLIEACVDD